PPRPTERAHRRPPRSRPRLLPSRPDEAAPPSRSRSSWLEWLPSVLARRHLLQRRLTVANCITHRAWCARRCRRDGCGRSRGSPVDRLAHTAHELRALHPVCPLPPCPLPLGGGEGGGGVSGASQLV